MQLIVAPDIGFNTVTGQRSRSPMQELTMSRRITRLAVAGLLVASIASPAAATMPVYGKFCGVDGASASDGKAVKPAKPARPKPDRKVARPPRIEGDIITGAGAGAGPGRDVKAKRAKPAGLLVPAIQKARG